MVLNYLINGGAYFTNHKPIKMSFDKPAFWDELVSKTMCVESYRGIVKAMFKDGKVNVARLLVLEEYTRGSRGEMLRKMDE